MCPSCSPFLISVWLHVFLSSLDRYRKIVYLKSHRNREVELDDYLKIMHQCQFQLHPAPLPPPPPPTGWPPGISIFLSGMANLRGEDSWAVKSPRVGMKKEGKCPVLHQLPLQHFSLIARSSSTILSILMCVFLFQLMSSFVIVLFLLRIHPVKTQFYGFSIVIKLLTLELIVRCKVNWALWIVL